MTGGAVTAGGAVTTLLTVAELIEPTKSVAALLTVAIHAWVPAAFAEALIVTVADFAKAKSRTTLTDRHP